MASRDIADCTVPLHAAWMKVSAEFRRRFPGWDIIVTCTHRSVQEQFDLFKKGRRLSGKNWVVSDAKLVVTNVDGWTKKSNHNYYPARAFDVALKQPDGKLNWPEKNKKIPPQWAALPDIATFCGLVNGGPWKSITDYPHFEMA